MPGGGGGSNETQTQTSVQTNDPWSGQQPFLTQGFEGARDDILQNPLEFFPGNTFTPFSPQTQQGLGMMENRALQGSPLVGAGQAELQKTLGGEYLGGDNPAFQGMRDRVAGDVTSRVNSQFESGGRFGSGIHAQTLGRGLAEGLAPIDYNNYQAERQNMMGAAGMAPGLANQDYHDISQLMGVGAIQEGKDYEGLQDQIQRFNFGQMEPLQRLNAYMGLIGGNYGGASTGTTTATMPSTSFNPLLFGTGTALTAANVASNLGWQPFAA
jgi:hypothetical protein